MSAPEKPSSEPKFGERISEDMTMGKLVDMLPKDGTPVVVNGVEMRYFGTFGYDEPWNQEVPD